LKFYKKYFGFNDASAILGYEKRRGETGYKKRASGRSEVR